MRGAGGRLISDSGSGSISSAAAAGSSKSTGTSNSSTAGRSKTEPSLDDSRSKAFCLDDEREDLGSRAGLLDGADDGEADFVLAALDEGGAALASD